MDKNNRCLLTERGMALPLMTLMILVLIPIGMGLCQLGSFETKTTVKKKLSTQAIQLADAGIRRVMTEIVNNANYIGPGTVQNLSTGQYTINISTPGSIFETNILPVNRYGIEAMGYVPDMAQARERRKIIALVNRIPFPTHSPYDYAISAGDGGIDLLDTCKIAGDVITSDTVNGAVHVTGAVTEEDYATANFPLPVAPSGVGVNDLGAINLNGTTNFTINPGTYTCTSIEIKGNAKITLATIIGGGAVHLYCSGDIDAGGTGFVNTGADATTFFLYGTGESGNIKFHGTSDVYAADYAPKYDCHVVVTAWGKGAINVYSYSGEGTSDIKHDPNLIGIGIVPGIDRVKMFAWREEKI
jgi:hypothetical protein